MTNGQWILKYFVPYILCIGAALGFYLAKTFPPGSEKPLWGALGFVMCLGSVFVILIRTTMTIIKSHWLDRAIKWWNSPR